MGPNGSNGIWQRAPLGPPGPPSAAPAGGPRGPRRGPLPDTVDIGTHVVGPLQDVLGEIWDFSGNLGFLCTFWTSKHEFSSLRAQRFDDRPATPVDRLCLTAPFFEAEILHFRQMFGRIGHNSPPGPPFELKTGLSILISPPRSVSEHQMAQKGSKSGQNVKIKNIKKKKN